MIEDVMVFVLGFSVATLLALGFLPAVWNRALRLTRRRLEMLVPLSEAEVAAERDGLRAEAAVMQRALEQRLEHADEAAAEQSARLGRQAVEVVDAQKARDAARESERLLREELERTSQSLAASQAQCATLQASLAEAEVQRKASEAEHKALVASSNELKVQIDEDRVALAALATRNAGLYARIAELEGELERAEAASASVADEAAAPDPTKEQPTSDSSTAVSPAPTRRDVDDLAERRVLMQAEAEARQRAERETAASPAQVSALRQRFDDLQRRLIDRAGATEFDAAAASRDLDELRAAVVAIGDEALGILAEPPAKADAKPDEPAQKQASKGPGVEALL